jgi:hypothetical protein|tara:strand:- start:4 stop:726 length:723 start_codon:yes stop_codon:yes gene_type:complete
MLKISDGNSKLRKTSGKVKAHLAEHGSLAGFTPRPKAYRVVSFNLPAGGYEVDNKSYITCPGADACLALCYARQGTFLFKGSKRVRIDNHQLLLTTHVTHGLQGVIDILDEAVKSVSKTVAVIRLHDSGDFFKKWYVQAWVEVIKRHPNILFYAYTKSFPMFKGIDLPSNFRVTYSFGGKWDKKIDGPNSRIFPTLDDRIKAGYVDGNDSDMPAILGEHNIGLVYHGVKNPTEEQFEALN